MSGSGQDERTSVLSGMEAGLHLICAKIKASRSLFEGLVLEPHLFGCHSSLPWSQEVGLGVNESSQRARGGCAKSGRPRPHPSPWGDPEVSRPKRPESPLHTTPEWQRGQGPKRCQTGEACLPQWLLERATHGRNAFAPALAGSVSFQLVDLAITELMSAAALAAFPA